MVFLIDGYNLLHAVGWLTARRRADGRLLAARTRLLDWLADRPGVATRGHKLWVVFDALHGPDDRNPETSHRGVKVRFAHRQTADDCIEELIAADRHPDRLTVVSNDGRLQTAADRAGGRGWKVQRFLDWLADAEARAADPATAEPPEKPEGPPPPAEAAALLQVFDVPQPKRTRPLK
ncbi:MAG: NYN domain-containing protein [Gemmataceae bacterium]